MTRWALRPDCDLEDQPDGSLRVRCGGVRSRSPDLPAEASGLVRRMALGPVALANVGFDSAPEAVFAALGPIATRSLVSSDNGLEILSIESCGPGPPPLTVTVPAADTTLHWTDPLHRALVGRPGRDRPATVVTDGFRIVVRGPALRATLALRGGASTAEAARSSGLDVDVVGATAAHLLATGALSATPRRGSPST